MLAREHRLRSGDEIREVIKSGKRVSNSFATLHYLSAEQPQFAVITSRAVGKAVVRNLVRRRSKAALYALYAQSPKIKAVVRVRAGAAELDFEKIADSIKDLLGRIR